MVTYDKNIGKFYPVFDFTTEFNSRRQIIRYLNFAKANLNSYFNTRNDESQVKKWEVSPIIVTFFSQEAINSLLFSFNSCDLSFYLEWTFNILSGKDEYLNNRDYRNHIISYIYICANNFMNLFIYKIRNLKICNKPNEQITKIKLLTTYCMSLIQNCIHLKEVENNLLHINNIFNSKYISESHLTSLNLIRNKIKEMGLDNIKIHNLLSEENSFKALVSEDPIYLLYEDNLYIADSPFEKYFKDLLGKYNLLLNRNKTKKEVNCLFCPEAFLVLLKELSILPLWSGLLLNYYQTNFPSNFYSDSFTFLTCKPVISYFNILKKHIMLKEKEFNLSIFVGKLYPELKRIYLKYYQKKEDRDKHFEENHVEMKETLNKKRVKSSKKKDRKLFKNQIEIWKGRGYKTMKRREFSYFGSDLNENDFSIKKLYKFDYGYLSLHSKKYFESIFNENIIIKKQEATPAALAVYLRVNKKYILKRMNSRLQFNQNQKRRIKLVKKIRESQISKNKIKKQIKTLDEKLVIDVGSLEIIFNKISNHNNFEFIRNVFFDNRNLLNKSVNYLRNLSQYSYGDLHPIFEEYIHVSDQFVPVNSIANGNCLYNTFSLLFFNNQIYFFIFKLLSIFIICEYYEELEKAFSDKNLKSFVIKHLKRKEWGSDFNILSLSILLNTTIYCYKVGSEKRIEYCYKYLSNIISDKNPINLAYIFLNNNPNMGHFFPFFLKKNTNKNEENFTSFLSNISTFSYPDNDFRLDIKERT